MKVLHIGKFYPPHPGGIETFMHDLLWGLASSGFECGAMVHTLDGDTVGRGEDGSIRLWRARSFGNLLYAPVSPGFALWLNRAIAEFQPDILHLHLPNTSAFWALLLPAARRLPWVVHWHADVITPLSRWTMRVAYRAYRVLEQAVLAHARAIVATSPPYQASSAPLARWQDRCHCIPLGLALDRLPDVGPEARQWAEAQWPVGQRRVLAIGRLSHYKGFDDLVVATRNLPTCHCLIVGDGEMRGDLLARIASAGVAAHVRLTGRLPAALLHALLDSCDVFCLPSVERTEAFGLVLVEAMARKKPVVACRIPGSGVGWVVQEGVNGLLAEPRQPPDLACKIRDALDRPALGLAGFDRANSVFSLAQVVEQTAEIYRSLRR